MLRAERRRARRNLAPARAGALLGLMLIGDGQREGGRVRRSARVAGTALLAVMLCAGSAAAQQPAETEPPALPPPAVEPLPAEPPPPLPPPGAAAAAAAPIVADTETGELKPMHVDLRATVNADILLAYIGLGASADLGLVPAGPGTLAVGAGFEYDFCGSVCWLFSAITPLDFSHRQIWPQARASYHIGVKSAKNLDIYPFVGLGPVFARSEISVDNGAARYVGTDTSIGVNFGGGINFFVAGPVFIGGEARIRYAAGEYDYRLESGDGSRTYDRGSVDTWSLTGIDVLVAVGVRLP